MTVAECSPTWGVAKDEISGLSCVYTYSCEVTKESNNLQWQFAAHENVFVLTAG